MKRVLIITYYWPPSGGSGVQRWLKMSKYLPENGWEPIIYTPLNPELNSLDESLEKEVSPNIIVIKRKIKEPYKLYKFLSGKKKGANIKANAIDITHTKDSNSKKNILKKAISNISIYIRGNFFIPDPRCWWIKPSVRFLKKWLKENKIDAIISTGPPHSMHLIAKSLHLSTNIPWLADFRDPWSRIFWFKHLKLSKKELEKHRRLELSVLKEADRVVVVSEQIKLDYLSDIKYLNERAKLRDSTTSTHIDENKIEIVTNGFDPADFNEKLNKDLFVYSQDIERDYKDKFIIAHTGLLTDSANPTIVWEALGEFVVNNLEFAKDLKIILMGQTDNQAKNDIKKFGLEKYVENMGYAEHSKCVAWQKRGNLLLLPLRKEKEAVAILTGKFFEYLASKSPILAIGPKESNLGDIIRETKSGEINEYTDINGVREYINRIYLKFKKGESKNGEHDIERFSRVWCSARIAEVLNKISEKK